MTWIVLLVVVLPLIIVTVAMRVGIILITHFLQRKLYTHNRTVIDLNGKGIHIEMENNNPQPTVPPPL